MSHVLEHYDPKKINSILLRIKKLLDTDGQLIIAVPDGADQITRLMTGKRDKILFEPHTIHFSLKLLCDILYRNGFIVTAASAPKSAEGNALYQDFFNQPIKKLSSADIVIVARHIEEKM